MFSFKKKDEHPTGSPEFLIVGLGNPGSKYENTRHNTGFLFMEMLSEKLGVKIKRLKFKALLGDAVIAGRRCLLMLPQTFMNNSGEAVREAAQFYKIAPQNIIIVFDDTSLPCGKLRIRRHGSAGGHNGIKSIILCLNSDEFPRIKIGIGDKPHPDFDLRDYVLSGFLKAEIPLVKQAMENACAALEMIVSGDIEGAMGRYN